jgi:hypothetical protein
MPMAETVQMVAAVVSPVMSLPSRRMEPAPRKPTPVTICAAMRAGSRPPMAGDMETTGENGRTHTDEDLRAQARWFMSLLALDAHDGATHKRHQNGNGFTPGGLDHPVQIT